MQYYSAPSTPRAFSVFLVMIDREHLKVKRSTAGAGLGLFTAVSIKKGARIIEYIGEIIDDAEYERRNSKYIFEVGKDRNIDGATRKNIARYINHSCRPNCESVDEDERIFIEVKRNIMLGEELTYDYGTLYWNTFIKKHGCRCVKCHKVELRATKKEIVGHENARHPDTGTSKRKAL